MKAPAVKQNNRFFYAYQYYIRHTKPSKSTKFITHPVTAPDIFFCGNMRAIVVAVYPLRLGV